MFLDRSDSEIRAIVDAIPAADPVRSVIEGFSGATILSGSCWRPELVRFYIPKESGFEDEITVRFMHQEEQR